MASEKPIQPMAGIIYMVMTVERCMGMNFALRRRNMQHVVHATQGLRQEYHCKQPGQRPYTETSRLPPPRSWTRWRSCWHGTLISSGRQGGHGKTGADVPWQVSEAPS